MYLSILRSPYAHAIIKNIDASKALQQTGVLKVIDGASIIDKVDPIPIIFMFRGTKPVTYRCLAYKKVRYVGEPVAVVVASDRGTAEDARDEIVADYEPLPALVDPMVSLGSRSILLHDDVPKNLVYEGLVESGNVDLAFKEAAFVVERTVSSHRYTGAALEPRSVVANFDNTDDILTVWSTTQVPHTLRDVLSECLKLSKSRVRVIVGNVGGSFGNYKYHPEDLITAYCALVTGRPVKWTADRREIFLGNYHAREQVHEISVAADKNGTLLGLKDSIIADHGAYLPREGVGSSILTTLMLPGPYRVKNIRIRTRCALTNKTPTGALRGFGHPEACFAMERIMDALGDETGIDRAELRFRNFIQREEFPYNSPTGMVYDSGDYSACLRLGLSAINYENWRKEWEKIEPGKRIGLGFAFYTENTGFGPTFLFEELGIRQPGSETATLSVLADGKILVRTGLCPHGQGSDTALSQVVGNELGVPIDDVVFEYGDTFVCPDGQGTFGSRSSVVGSALLVEASKELVSKAKTIAAVMLNEKENAVAYRAGYFFRENGDGYKKIGWKNIAKFLQNERSDNWNFEKVLSVTTTYDPKGMAFPNASHLAIIEVDEETGKIRILKYVISHDCGVLINPMIVEGEVQGGTAQGISGALLEELPYGKDGELLASSFIDYLMATSVDIPEMEILHQETRSPINSLGVKGVGEGGAIAPAAAIASAIDDALRDFKVRVKSTPLSPEKIWRGVHG